MATEHEHSSVKTYLLIGLILTVITAAEVAIFYIPAIADTGWLAPVLVTMSAGKFALVVMFYMHLKFDSRIFSVAFFAPMVLAMVVVVSIILLFKVLPAYLP
ncbi:MAG TPA: cytochrome C oxidase subunit IV family protein [Longimicrobiales bacterium]|nr:cytochrome C oxidase subunit IV family protein [Longimicrobiales bacterium]